MFDIGTIIFSARNVEVFSPTDTLILCRACGLEGR